MGDALGSKYRPGRALREQIKEKPKKQGCTDAPTPNYEKQNYKTEHWNIK
jgi:hypothetical protein